MRAGRPIYRLTVAACAAMLFAGCGSAGVSARATQTPGPLTPPSSSPSPSATATRSVPPNASLLPLPYDTGPATQVITVVATATRSTSATLQAWAKEGAGWVRHGPAIKADIGNKGMTAEPNENLAATPMGSFTLTEAFGRAGNPGTQLPYFRTDPSDYWVTDTTSVHYNTHYRCSRNCPFDASAGENLYRVGYMYTHAVVMDYNRSPVLRGAGSAFFLHVTEGKATTGCIAIPKPDLVAIMRWLTPEANPRILVGLTH